MSASQEKTKQDFKQLDGLISSATKKINGKKENDICRYIPSPTGVGYIHHFTLRKMRVEEPEKLHSMISKYIINVDKPLNVAPKQRAARGSRKRRDQIVFTKQDIDRMLHMARNAGDREMIRKLTPKKDIRSIKRELLSSIRHGRIDQDLWHSYVEIINSYNALNGTPSLANAN